MPGPEVDADGLGRQICRLNQSSVRTGDRHMFGVKGSRREIRHAYPLAAVLVGFFTGPNAAWAASSVAQVDASLFLSA